VSRDASRESKAVKHSLHDASSKGRAAELTHIARNRDTASDDGIIINDHVFVFILNAFLDRISGLSENGFPDVGVYRHESWEKSDLAFWCLGQ